MPVNPSTIKNAYKRSDEYRKQKKHKGQAKLKRRLEIKKSEVTDEDGSAKKKARLAANVPQTIDNTRQYGSSYLTSNPVASSSTSTLDDEDAAAPEASAFPDEDFTEGGISSINPAARKARDPSEPPRILLTTSAKATRDTYSFAQELTGIFPGGKFFKRPPGRGFELGNISKWAVDRGYDAIIVINEDRKIINALSIINLPYGPTAYFKLTSLELSKQISGHARPTPHSPELILNNFQTRLGLSIGSLFGSLFPPLPQFEGRQVVTLHNQRDFLFFRRHRYAFRSIEKTALQEIGPRFTLKLRWLKKGLPKVTGGGSVAVEPELQGVDSDEEPEKVDDNDDDDEKVEKGGDVSDEDNQEAAEEDDEKDQEEINSEDEEQAQHEREQQQTEVRKRKKSSARGNDKDDEYQWKWKPKLEVSRRTFFL